MHSVVVNGMVTFLLKPLQQIVALCYSEVIDL